MLCRMNSPVPMRLDVHPQLDLGRHHGAAKINQLHPEWLILQVDKHNVVWFDVRMQDTHSLQGVQGHQDLQGQNGC